MAAALGVPYQTYNNWERGHQIPVNEAKRIKEAAPGLTGDYLLWGDIDALAADLLRKMKSDSEKK
jgi:hypothetical protein